MDSHDALKLAMTAGEIMLKNGAETYRVEDTMIRILNNCDFIEAESFVTTTGLFASVDSPSGTVTQIKRVKNRTINFDKICQVNDVSRKCAEGAVSAEEALKSLQKINTIPPVSPFVRLFAAGFTCFSFTYIFGGALMDCMNSFLTGFVMQLFFIQMNKNNISSVLTNMMCGAIIGLLSLMFLNIRIGTNIDKVIIGAIMPLVPGVGLTNAIRDILEGDYLSGTSRIMDAVIVAVCIATGVGMVLKIWFSVFGGVAI